MASEIQFEYICKQLQLSTSFSPYYTVFLHHLQMKRSHSQYPVRTGSAATVAFPDVLPTVVLDASTNPSPTSCTTLAPRSVCP